MARVEVFHPVAVQYEANIAMKSQQSEPESLRSIIQRQQTLAHLVSCLPVGSKEFTGACNQEQILYDRVLRTRARDFDDLRARIMQVRGMLDDDVGDGVFAGLDAVLLDITGLATQDGPVAVTPTSDGAVIVDGAMPGTAGHGAGPGRGPFDKQRAEAMLVAEKHGGIFKGRVPTEKETRAYLLRFFTGVSNEPHRAIRQRLWPENKRGRRRKAAK